MNEDPDGNGNAITFNARMPGQYHDSETGLHYNYFRTYDPKTGRYLTSDPIGLVGGNNTYRYVGGNPLKWTDALGLKLHTSGGKSWKGLWDAVRPLIDSTLTEAGADWLDQREKMKQEMFNELSDELRNNRDLLDPYNERGLQRERVDCETNCERKYGGECQAPPNLKQCKDDCWSDYRRERGYYRERNRQIEESLRGLR